MPEKNTLYKQFLQLELLLRRRQIQTFIKYGPLADPHRGQGRILALLSKRPEISQKDLSSFLNIRSQSMGELLAKLEKNGYIERMPSERDRRNIEIRLTDSGRQAANISESEFSDESIFNCLNEEEQKTLSDYFTRIIAELEEQVGENGSDFNGVDLQDRLRFHRHSRHDHSPFDPRGHSG
jgi:Transcriptional regulators